MPECKTSLTTTDIFKIQQLRFVYKYYNGSLPTHLQNIPIILNTDVHSHNTRHRTDIHIESVNTEFAKKTIIYNIAHVLNNTSS